MVYWSAWEIEQKKLVMPPIQEEERNETSREGLSSQLFPWVDSEKNLNSTQEGFHPDLEAPLTETQKPQNATTLQAHCISTLYVRGLSEKIQGMCSQLGLRTVFSSPNTLRQQLVQVTLRLVLQRKMGKEWYMKYRAETATTRTLVRLAEHYGRDGQNTKQQLRDKIRTVG